MDSDWLQLAEFDYAYPEPYSVFVTDPANVSVLISQHKDESGQTGYVVESGLDGGFPYLGQVFSHEARYSIEPRHLADGTAVLAHVVNYARDYAKVFWLDRSYEAHEAFNCMWTSVYSGSAMGESGSVETLFKLPCHAVPCRTGGSLVLRTKSGAKPEVICIDSVEQHPSSWHMLPDGRAAAGATGQTYQEIRRTVDGGFEHYTARLYEGAKYVEIGPALGIAPLEDGGWGFLAAVRDPVDYKIRAVLVRRDAEVVGGATFALQPQLDVLFTPELLTPTTPEQRVYYRGMLLWLDVVAAREPQVVRIVDMVNRQYLGAVKLSLPPDYPFPPRGQDFLVVESSGARLYHASSVVMEDAGVTRFWIRQLAEVDDFLDSVDGGIQ